MPRSRRQDRPRGAIIDITHLVPPGDVRRGAAVLAQTMPYLPAAVHVAVVDPGVGTTRRGRDRGRRGILVGPDNGLLSWAAAALGGVRRAFQLTNGDSGCTRCPRRSTGVTSSFPSRRISPRAGLVSVGTELDTGDLVTLPAPTSRVHDGEAEGEVMSVDRFGNVQLSIARADPDRIGIGFGSQLVVRCGRRQLTVPYLETFAAVAPGELVAFTDSAGLISLAVNAGDAAQQLGLPPGAHVRLRRRRPGKPERHRQRLGIGRETRVKPGQAISSGHETVMNMTESARALSEEDRGAAWSLPTRAGWRFIRIPPSRASRHGRRTQPGIYRGIQFTCVAIHVRRNEWWLRTLHVTNAWETTRGSGVTVAVLDTGVDPAQADLTGSVTTRARLHQLGRGAHRAVLGDSRHGGRQPYRRPPARPRPSRWDYRRRTGGQDPLRAGNAGKQRPVAVQPGHCRRTAERHCPRYQLGRPASARRSLTCRSTR